MSLKEIPDRVFVSLGRRGFDPVNPKQCPKCGSRGPAGLKLLEKVEREKVEHGEGVKRMVDYKIQCLGCANIFFVRLQHVFQLVEGEERRITTMVNILDEQLEDLGWLGNY